MMDNKNDNNITIDPIYNSGNVIKNSTKYPNNDSDKYAKIKITKGMPICQTVFVTCIGISLCVIPLYSASEIPVMSQPLYKTFIEIMILIASCIIGVSILRACTNNFIYRIRYNKVKKNAKKKNISIEESYVEAIAIINEISKDDAYRLLRKKSRYMRLKDKLDLIEHIDL